MHTSIHMTVGDNKCSMCASGKTLLCRPYQKLQIDWPRWTVEFSDKKIRGWWRSGHDDDMKKRIQAGAMLFGKGSMLQLRQICMPDRAQIRCHCGKYSAWPVPQSCCLQWQWKSRESFRKPAYRMYWNCNFFVTSLAFCLFLLTAYCLRCKAENSPPGAVSDKKSVVH